MYSVHCNDEAQGNVSHMYTCHTNTSHTCNIFEVDSYVQYIICTQMYHTINSDTITVYQKLEQISQVHVHPIMYMYIQTFIILPVLCIYTCTCTHCIHVYMYSVHVLQ